MQRERERERERENSTKINQKYKYLHVEVHLELLYTCSCAKLDSRLFCNLLFKKSLFSRFIRNPCANLYKLISLWIGLLFMSIFAIYMFLNNVFLLHLHWDEPFYRAINQIYVCTNKFYKLKHVIICNSRFFLISTSDSMLLRDYDLVFQISTSSFFDNLNCINCFCRILAWYLG